VIRQLKIEGVTVFFTTHILSDLPGLCSRIGILSHGRLIFVGTTEQFCDSDTLSALEERFVAVIDNAEKVNPA
ncbi:MAG: ABC transporter ATP-binding protein, partial [Candidatus Riflebacteria bacterium]|nr:ABC transporter ATP-binding protein [Candidatus Riflebacteria bacterium]